VRVNHAVCCSFGSPNESPKPLIATAALQCLPLIKGTIGRKKHGAKRALAVTESGRFGP
jgi:hypothetical protein